MTPPPQAPAHVRIDRLSLRLPAGFGDRAPTVARLTAAGLAAALGRRRPPPDWDPGPVHVTAAHHEPDGAIADRAVTELTRGWR